MHVEFSRDDYLWLEIQKHLLRLEELTTDVTYRKVVYKMLMPEDYYDDAYTSAKVKHKDTVETIPFQHLDYVKNNDRFVLQQVLITLKYIESVTKSEIIDKPQRFFYDTFHKVQSGEININSFHKNTKTKVTITDRSKNIMKVSKMDKRFLYIDEKPSTVIKKA